MKWSTAIIALGAVALLTGSLSLDSLVDNASSGVTTAVDLAGTASGTPQAAPSSVAAPVAGLHGVDSSIERVLIDLGIASVSSGNDLSDLPATVVRVLSAHGIALTVTDRGAAP